MALNARQEMFVEYYIQLNQNGTQAAIAAGYSERSAGQIAHRLLKNAEISTRIRERTAEVLKATQMGSDEVLARIAAIARGAMSLFASLDEQGRVVMKAADIETARANLHLVKKVVNAPGEWGTRREIEVHDPLPALTTLAKHHRLIDRNNEVDWREELQRAGIDPAAVYDAIVQQIQSNIAGAQ